MLKRWNFFNSRTLLFNFKNSLSTISSWFRILTASMVLIISDWIVSLLSSMKFMSTRMTESKYMHQKWWFSWILKYILLHRKESKPFSISWQRVVDIWNAQVFLWPSCGRERTGTWRLKPNCLLIQHDHRFGPSSLLEKEETSHCLQELMKLQQWVSQLRYCCCQSALSSFVLCLCTHTQQAQKKKRTQQQCLLFDMKFRPPRPELRTKNNSLICHHHIISIRHPNYTQTLSWDNQWCGAYSFINKENEEVDSTCPETFFMGSLFRKHFPFCGR